jgi:hypothetical protein
MKRRAQDLRFGAGIIAATLALFSFDGALAQTASDPHRPFGRSPPADKVQAVHAEWRRLSQSEVNCVERSLRDQRSSVWNLIQRGIGPSDAAVAKVRAACRRPGGVAGAGPDAAQKTSAQKPLGEYWALGDAVLSATADGDVISFHYYSLRHDAEAPGAKPGVLLLHGKFSNQRFLGTAYVHSTCGRFPYRVDGSTRDNNRRLELQGQKPHFNAECGVIGTSLDSLTLKSVDQAFAEARKAAGGASAVATETGNISPQRPANTAVAAPPAAPKVTISAISVGKAVASKAAFDEALAALASSRAAVAKQPETDAPASEKAQAEPKAEAAVDEAATNTTAGRAAPDEAPSIEVVAAQPVVDAPAAVREVVEQAAGSTATDIVVVAAATGTATQDTSWRPAAGEPVAIAKIPTDKPTEKAASQAQVTKHAADESQTAAQPVAAERAASTEQAAVDKAADSKATVQGASVAGLASDTRNAAAVNTMSEKTAVDLSRADVERARAEAVKAQAEAERARKEAEKTIAEAIFAGSAAQSKIIFIYGLFCGLAALAAGVVLFFGIRYTREALLSQFGLVRPEHAIADSRKFDLLVDAVLAEQNRRAAREQG